MCNALFVCVEAKQSVLKVRKGGGHDPVNLCMAGVFCSKLILLWVRKSVLRSRAKLWIVGMLVKDRQRRQV
jgi:hypothetical protein